MARSLWGGDCRHGLLFPTPLARAAVRWAEFWGGVSAFARGADGVCGAGVGDEYGGKYGGDHAGVLEEGEEGRGGGRHF